MCLGIPGRVVGLVGPDRLVDVDVGGVTRTIDAALVEDVGLAVDDWVLIHMGFALEVLDAEQADAALRGLAPRDPGPPEGT